MILLFLMQVPAGDFSGYVRSLVKELYGPIHGAIRGDLTGPGTVGTVLLCESLLSYLPSGSRINQPTDVFRAYEILPFTRLQHTGKIDLSTVATTQNGLLYIPRPAVARLWIPLRTLPSSARATATAMICFLEKLKEGRRSVGAVCRAGSVIVDQFKRDLMEMGVVQDSHLFQGLSATVCVRDALTADEYVSRVFDPTQLPSEMSTKAFLGTAFDLFDRNELRGKIAEALLKGVSMVPHTTVHARAVHFSPILCTVIVQGPVSSSRGLISPVDAHRLVIAASQLLKDNFSVTNKALKEVQKNRPRLVQCVREAIAKATSRTRGRFRHILAVVAFATMMLADREHILPKKVVFQKHRERTNLYRYILMEEMKRIIHTTDVVAEEETPEEEGRGRRQVALRSLPNCSVTLNRIVVPRRN